MSDELADVVDENNVLTGKTLPRSEIRKNGLWQRASHVWIYNSKGDLLLQLRARDKKLFPGLWDISASGHVMAGETPEEAAIREVKEEVGLDISKSDLILVEVRKKEVRPDGEQTIPIRQFYYVYLCQQDIDAKELVLQREEVSKVFFVDLDTLEQDLRNNPAKYVPHDKYWFDVIEAVRTRMRTPADE